MTNKEKALEQIGMQKRNTEDCLIEFDVLEFLEETLKENTKLKTENKRLNTGLNTLISKIKDHSNTEKVSTAKLIKGKHAYYRAISVTKVIKFINELKMEV